jgi:hypothetical protein
MHDVTAIEAGPSISLSRRHGSFRRALGAAEKNCWRWAFHNEAFIRTNGYGEMTA